jgi:hypothetical protein
MGCRISTNSPRVPEFRLYPKPTDFYFGSMITIEKIEQTLKQFPDEIQQVLLADFMTTIGDLFRTIGFSVITDASLAELYKRLLNPEDKKD